MKLVCPRETSIRRLGLRQRCRRTGVASDYVEVDLLQQRREDRLPGYRRLRSRLLFAVAALVAGAAATCSAEASAIASALEPETLARAQAIRADVDTRYRQLPGRKLAVTEVTTTGVLDSLVLLGKPLELPRAVPTSNGIYFAICSVRAKCPYPARSAAWPVAALLPRRQALELALHTFIETPASLVVVSLPTAEPVWAVFERDDLLATVDPATVLAELVPLRARVDAPLRELVDRLTQPLLYRPIPTLPPSLTIFAIALGRP